MNRSEYNGWTNYETWVVKLWMDNDAGTYDYYRTLATETLERAEAQRSFTKEERATLDLADLLKDEFAEGEPDLRGVYADLLHAAMSEVNWHEIAQSMIDEIKQEVA